MTDIKKLPKLFNNKELFNLALTHRSWVNEHKTEKKTNERLEFLGDAVLEFVISESLYDKFPNKEEGFLTALRANLVNTVNLSRVAKRLGVGDLIKLSKGEEETGGRNNPSLLADTTEAIIGAIFIDGGIKKARDFIQENILKNIEEIISKPLKDAKSRLQETVQAKGYPTPKYTVVEESGPDHAKIFIVDVRINGKTLSKGRGKNKSEAQQKAAEKALKNFS